MVKRKFSKYKHRKQSHRGCFFDFFSHRTIHGLRGRRRVIWSSIQGRFGCRSARSENNSCLIF